MNRRRVGEANGQLDFHLEFGTPISRTTSNAPKAYCPDAGAVILPCCASCCGRIYQHADDVIAGRPGLAGPLDSRPGAIGPVDRPRVCLKRRSISGATGLAIREPAP